MRPVKLCVALLAFVLENVSSRSVSREEQLPPTCESKIYCQGPLLNTIQMSKFFEDSKMFVDMSTLHEPDEVLKNFEKMMAQTNNDPSRGDIKAFLDENFVQGEELEDWSPSDFKANPSFLKNVQDAKVKAFAQEVVKIWPKLGRKVVDDVKNNSDHHSLIYVPNGFIIPGGRFREFYYWDSYWILKGVLLSEMYDTAKGILGNFLHMVDNYGFIPNGGRVYYLARSQPPLLTKMAKDYFKTTNDEEWLQENIQTLTKELEWWRQHRFVTVKGHQLASYNAKSLGPRPESYREDTDAASIFDENQRQNVFNELKSAAESGWDFSTRWIFDSKGGSEANISFIETSRVIPVDLNSILYGAFADLSELHGIVKNQEAKTLWLNRANDLKTAIEKVLFDEEEGVWFDYDLKLEQHRKHFATSNLSPLWTKAFDGSKKHEYGSNAAAYLKKEGIDSFKGGIPSTRINSGEQWDFPNAWPPLQAIMVHGLRNTENPDALKLAEEFAHNWITANLIGFEKENALFEKYDAVTPGQYGGGGEYNVQTGFGWTNGVVLDFINTYPNTEIAQKGKPKTGKKNRKHG